MYATERLDLAALDEHAFASRKRPEHMRLRLLECPVCDLVYASPVPSAETLARYEGAAFDSAEEARFAAQTYAKALEPIIARLPDLDGALDIGTGEGGFLNELIDIGFSNISGIEPSSDPIAAAAPGVAGLIEHGVFHAGVRSPASLSLVTCFQTIEHVPDPAALVRDAASLLKPGGLLVIVCHDRRAAANRLLGLRSPIVDIEHMQLFSPRSLTELLSRGGLVDVSQRAIRNRYPVRYWARLLPVPTRIGVALDRGLRRVGLATRPVTLPVGNRLAWGAKA